MKLLLLSFSLFISFAVTAQEIELEFKKDLSINFPERPIELKSNKLVSNYSFNKLIFEDLSHLLFDGSAPTEGIEATFDEDKSKISLSGNLGDFYSGFLTVKGDFSTTDDGVYFIDENNGSKNAKLTLNYYRPFWGKRSYDSPMTNAKTQRAFYSIEKSKQLLIGKTIKNFYYTKTLLKDAGFFNSENVTDANKFDKRLIEKFDKALKKLGYCIDHTKINKELLEISSDYIKEKKLSGNNKDNIFKISIGKKPKSDDDDDIKDVNIPKSQEKSEIISKIDIDKVISLYETTISTMDSIASKLVTEENKLAQPIWNSKQFSFVGVSPSYEREEIANIFIPNEALSFDENFTNGTQDLYGLEGQFGFFYQAKKAHRKNWYTKMLFARATAKVGKGSNRSEFKKRTYNFPATNISTIGTDNITSPNTKEGNYNKIGNTYNTGNLFALSIESYWFPHERYGIFSQLGYDNLNFDDGDGKDIDIYSLRLGIVINIKSKEKNFATLQLFADRSDLSKSPNSKDEDLRFGFKVGVPFSFKKNL